MNERSQRAPRGSFLRALASDYRAAASLVGLLVYGVVRVAYDAFYARLGVFPEAVGLSETTILGRALLYLALAFSVAAIFVGLWLVAVGWSLERSPGRRVPGLLRGRRPLLATLVLPPLVVGIVAAGSKLRSHLTSDHLAYYCIQRCKFAALKPNEVDLIGGLVRRHGSEHRGWRFVDFGPEWLIAIPLVLLVATGVLAVVLARRPSWSTRVRSPLAVFVLLAVCSLAAGLLAPHLIAASEESSQESSQFVDSHPGLLKWVVFVLVLAAVVGGLLAALARLVEGEPKRSPWLIASFVVVVPVLLGFFDPEVPLFMEEEGAATVLGAVGLWIALLLIAFALWPNLRDGTVRASAGFGILLALIVSLTLYLAWERGINLAKKAAGGDQILVRRFSILSVRAGVVCLEPSATGSTLHLARHPYVYLGETGGTLVLYDFVADLAREVPEAFPVRVPASGVTVRVARYGDPNNKHTIDWANWDCAPNS